MMREHRQPSALPRLGVYALLVLALLATSACADPERLGIYDDAFRIEGPVQLDGNLAMLNSTLEEIVLIAVDGEALAFKHLPAGRKPVGMSVTPDKNRIALLSAKDPTLTVIDVKTGSQRVYEVGSLFDAVAFSPDSRFAITHYSPGGTRPSGVFFNPLEYTIVDLQAAANAQGATLERSLRGFGATPSKVYFVPEFELSGAKKERYAMFLFDSYVTFADLTDPSFEVTVPFTLAATDNVIIPKEVLFTDAGAGPELQDSFVYMLAVNSNDVYAINLLPGIDENGVTRLQPSLNQLPSGDHPVDMTTFIGPDGREKILTVNHYSHDIAVIDAATASVIRIPIEEAGTNIHLYLGFNEDSGQTEPHAMIYGVGSRIVSFVRLMEVEDRLGQALESLSVGKPVERLINSPVDNQVIIVHSAGDGLSILDLAGRSYSPLQAQAATLSNVVLDSSGRRLFASLSGSPNLNTIDLGNSQAAFVPLDFPIVQLFFMPEANSLIAFHNDDGGLLTALQVDVLAEGENRVAAPPTRADARIYAGFLLDGLLEGQE